MNQTASACCRSSHGLGILSRGEPINMILQSERLKLTFLLLALFLLSARAEAADIFAWLGMATRPLGVSEPEWVRKDSYLRLEWDTHEYYKRWVEGRQVNDFSGTSSKAELSLNLLPKFSLGVRKKLREPQTWSNSSTDRSDVFSMKSETESGDVFLRFFRDNYALELGNGSGKSSFSGEYSLHRDVVNALGANPPVYMNNGETHKYVRFYGYHKRVRFVFDFNEGKYAHRVSANTPALNVTLNHNRAVREKAAELSWHYNSRISPYLRYNTYQDSGSGVNYKDLKFDFGSNRSEIELTAMSFGSIYHHRRTRYFAEYSRINFDVDLESGANLITLNPLFLFGTNRVAYRIDYRPDDPWALRLGARQVYRGIECFAQYSYSAFSGVSTTWSRKDYKMFAKTATDITVSDMTVDLHRLALCLSRPDNNGNWQVKLNLLVPIAESVERKEILPPVPGPPPPPAPPEPEEKIRGGWQLIVSREFIL